MSRTHRGQRFARPLVALAAAGLCAHAMAQSADSSDKKNNGADKDAGKSTASLERIVVTAQKRAEPLQEVPIPVSAFDARALEKTGAADVRDIAVRAPGFTMTNYNVAEPQYAIRGMTSNSDSAAGDATVAVFVDEVFMGRPAGANFSFLDLERVEILRGPQGTLFGRNTSGGAISVTTAKPGQQNYSKLFTSVGTYGSFEAAAVLNRALSDNAKLKVALGHREHDGYSHNIRTGASLDGGRNDSARVQLLLDLAPSTTLLLSGDASRDRADGLARVPYPVFSNTATAPLINKLYPPGTNLRLSYSDPDSFQHRDVHGFSARLEHEFGFAALTSITAYRNTRINHYEDLSALPAPWVLKNLDKVKEGAEQWSQELRLASLPGSRFNWVGGVYFFDEKVLRNESFETTFSLMPAAGGKVQFNQDVRNRSAALFGQVDYPLAKDLNLSFGLRETFDRKNADQSAVNLDPADTTPGIPLFPGQPYHVVASKSWNALTGKLGADYKLSREQMVYASLSRGYKSGLFPSQNNSVQSVGVPLEPEKVWNYEAGIKSEWLDRRLRVNANVFKFDYKDMQQYNLTPQLVLVAFSVDAKAKGAELELQAAPADWLTLGATAAYLDSEVTRGNFNGASLVGNRLARAPKQTYSVYAEATRDFEIGRVSGRMEYARKGSYYIEAINSAIGLIPSYGLFDARLSYRANPKAPEIALWGKNLANTLYQAHIISFLGNGFSTFGPPRTVGISATWTLKD